MSNEKKHTPGPWYSHEVDDDLFYITELARRNNPKWKIATTFDKANARLIASAPELLETLKKAKNLIDQDDRLATVYAPPFYGRECKA